MKVLFMGTGEFGIPALRAMLAEPSLTIVGLVTQPDRPAGRKQELKAPVTKELVQGFSKDGEDIPIFQPDNINCPEVLAELKGLQADIAVVCSYGQILKKEILESPRLGCLNIHGSLLPRHRGAACVQGAILEGDFHSGVTIIWMDEGLDTGDILLSRKVPLRGDETAGQLHDTLAELGPEAILESLKLVQNDAASAPRNPQDGEAATYMPRLKKQDARIEWSKPAEQVNRLVRAMAPWPVSHTSVRVQGSVKALKVFSAELLENDSKGTLGEVLQASGDSFVVQCAQGSLRLLEVQLEGKRRMAVRDFLAGVKLEIGERLGS